MLITIPSKFALKFSNATSYRKTLFTCEFELFKQQKKKDLVTLWIHDEFDRITVCHRDFCQSYAVELQQNHGVNMISSNSL